LAKGNAKLNSTNADATLLLVELPLTPDQLQSPALKLAWAGLSRHTITEFYQSQAWIHRHSSHTDFTIGVAHFPRIYQYREWYHILTFFSHSTSAYSTLGALAIMSYTN